MVQKSLCKWALGTSWTPHSRLRGKPVRSDALRTFARPSYNPTAHTCATCRCVGGQQESAAANQRLLCVLTLSTISPLAGWRIALRRPRACPRFPGCPRSSRGPILLRPTNHMLPSGAPAVHSSHAPRYGKKCSDSIFRSRSRKILPNSRFRTFSHA